MYNQIGDKDLKNSCSVLAFLDYLAYEYYIKIPRDLVVTLLDYLEKILAFSRLWGASAGVVYPAIVKYIEWKYGLKIKILVGNIKKINDGKGHVLGFKGADKVYLSLIKDKEVTKEDVDSMNRANGHFVYWEDGILSDNLGNVQARWSYDLIQRAYDRGLFYYNTREFIPGDEKTRRVAEKTQAIGRARKKAGFKNIYLTPQDLKALHIV